MLTEVVTVNLALNLVDPADLTKAEAYLTSTRYVLSWNYLPRTDEGLLIVEVQIKGGIGYVSHVKRGLKTRGVVANIAHIGR